MGQRLRHENKHTTRFPDREQALQDQTRLDRLTQADFIRQQHPRDLPRCHFTQNIKLVRNQLQAPTEKASDLRLAKFGLSQQRAVPQIKNFS